MHFYLEDSLIQLMIDEDTIAQLPSFSLERDSAINQIGGFNFITVDLDGNDTLSYFVDDVTFKRVIEAPEDTNDVNTFISDIETSSKNIEVYPNPADQIFTLKVHSNQAIQNIQLVDLMGRNHNVNVLENNQNTLRIDVSNVSVGHYILIGSNNERLIFRKKIMIN